MSDLEWDETNYPHKVSGKSIDTSFLADMLVEHYCDEMHVDGWGRAHFCDRQAGHTGRHLTTEHLSRYPVAVWR